MQSDEEVEQTQETCVRSRLLSGLSKENIRDVAMLAVTFGPIVQIDGPNPRKRAVLPLHPELLQATLLQSLKRIEENLVSSTLLALSLDLLCPRYLSLERVLAVSLHPCPCSYPSGST